MRNYRRITVSRPRGAEFTLGGLGVFLAGWTVMMGAMMLPSAAPMILTFAAVQARRDRNVTVVAAYILVWAYASLVVYVLLHAGKDLVYHFGWYQNGAWARLAQGKVVAARVADHVEPHHGDPLKFWTGKLQSLCSHCHESRKKRWERLGYDRTVGVDGWPIDPNHPIYR